MRVSSEDNKYIRNQCSLVVRADGQEIEIPVTFGMTADEIRAIYPFLLPILNQKIENPAIQFSRSTKHGMFTELTEDEYNAELCKVMEQSKFWYDKSEAGLLDIAVRFALDMQMRGITTLSSIFASNNGIPVKVRPVTKDEAVEIMRRLHIEAPDDIEDITGDKDFVDDRVEADDFDGINFDKVNDDIDLDDETSADTTSKAVSTYLDSAAQNGVSAFERELQAIDSDKSDSNLAEIANKDFHGVDTEKYKPRYEAKKFDDDEINEAGLLVGNDKGSAAVVEDTAKSTAGSDVIDIDDDDELYEDDDDNYVDFASDDDESE